MSHEAIIDKDVFLRVQAEIARRVLKKSSGIDCPARTIHEEDLQGAVVTAINDAWSRKDAVIPFLQENIREVLESDTEERLIEKITVYDEKLTIEFKSGLEIDVEA